RTFQPPGLECKPGRDAIEFHVDAARPLRVRAWHPWLVPARDGGEAELTGDPSEVVLKLEHGPEITFASPLHEAASGSRVNVELFAPGRTDPPAHAFTGWSTDSLFHCGPPPSGMFDVFLDAWKSAPI